MTGKRRIWTAILLCALGLLAAQIYRSNYLLHVQTLRISSDRVAAPLRIVHLSDLHNTSFGQNNGDLVAAVKEQKPDLIFFTGDLVTGTVKQTDEAMNLVEELVTIAPVYISLGNHERMHEGNFGSDLTGMLEYRGAEVLEFEYEDVMVGENKLRIGGLSGFCVPEKYLWSGEAKVPECEFLKEMADTRALPLLLCHVPVSWILNDGISYWDVDFVFSGHLHGGQWNLPVLGPVYAPDMGLFPEAVDGLFSSGDGQKHLIVSRGLGNSLPVFRLNNPPQVLVVEIIPQL